SGLLFSPSSSTDSLLIKHTCRHAQPTVARTRVRALTNTRTVPRAHNRSIRPPGRRLLVRAPAADEVPRPQRRTRTNPREHQAPKVKRNDGGAPNPTEQQSPHNRAYRPQHNPRAWVV